MKTFWLCYCLWGLGAAAAAAAAAAAEAEAEAEAKAKAKAEAEAEAKAAVAAAAKAEAVASTTTLAAFFDLGQDETCPKGTTLHKKEKTIGLQKAVEWTVQRIRERTNATVELQLEDTCADMEVTASKLLNLAAERKLFQKSSSKCNDSDAFAGILFSSLSVPLPGSSWLTSTLSRPVVTLPSGICEVDPASLRAAFALMRRLKWRKFIVAAQEKEIVELVREAALGENICLVGELLLDSRGDSHSSNLSSVDDGHGGGSLLSGGLEASSNVLVIGDDESNVSNMFDLSPDGGRTFVVIASSKLTQEVKERRKGDDVVLTVEKNFLNTPAYADGADDYITRCVIMRTAHLVLDTLQRRTNCSKQQDQGPEDPRKNASIEKILDLGSEPDHFIIQVTSSNSSIRIADFKDEKLRLREDDHNDSAILLNSLAQNGQRLETCALETPPFTFLPPTLRRDNSIPAAVYLTAGAIAVLCCVIFFVYLLCKSCEDVTDGSQAFSLLILAALGLIYSCLALFSLQPDRLVCFARTHATAFAYAVLYSAMLARSLMLATTDTDGLPGHISGLLQAALFVLLASVQVALSLQEWFLRKDEPLFYEAVIDLNREKLCVDTGVKFLFRLSYPMVLIGLQLLISPFIVSSRRNYREGALLALGGVASLLLWLGWTVPYLVTVPTTWSNKRYLFDLAVCFGIIAVPSTLLLVIFVPKCYLMSAPTDFSSQRLSFHRPVTMPPPSVTKSLHHLRGINSNSTDDVLMENHHLRHPSSMQRLNLSVAGSTTLTAGSSSNEELGTNHNVTSGNRMRALNISSLAAQNESINENKNPMEAGYLEEEKDLYDSLKDPTVRHSFASPNSAFMEYPTFKLDRNTVVDTSMRWERYSFVEGTSNPPKQQSQPLPKPKFGTRL